MPIFVRDAKEKAWTKAKKACLPLRGRQVNANFVMERQWCFSENRGWRGHYSTEGFDKGGFPCLRKKKGLWWKSVILHKKWRVCGRGSSPRWSASCVPGYIRTRHPCPPGGRGRTRTSPSLLHRKQHTELQQLTSPQSFRNTAWGKSSCEYSTQSLLEYYCLLITVPFSHRQL